MMPGFKIIESDHLIVPIMLGDAKLSQDVARDLLTEGIYVIGIIYSVVSKGQARIRVHISAAVFTQQLDQAIQAFIKVGRAYQVIS